MTAARSTWQQRNLDGSAKDDWATPRWFFALLDQEFGFDLDPCGNPRRKLRADLETWGPAQDGLARSWTGRRCFVNPPYGRELAVWAEKAASESASVEVAVLLVPVRSDARWWHRLMGRAREVRLLDGRLAFGDLGVKAPFASALLVLPGTQPKLSSMSVRGY